MANEGAVMECRECAGQGIVCDSCGRGDKPVRLVEGEELCRECLDKILEQIEEGEHYG